MTTKSKESSVRFEDKVTQPKTSNAQVTQSNCTKDQNLTYSQNSQDHDDFTSLRDVKPAELQEEVKNVFAKSTTQKYENRIMNQAALVNHDNDSELKSSLEELENEMSQGRDPHNKIQTKKEWPNRLDASFASPRLDDSSRAFNIFAEPPILGSKHKAQKSFEMQDFHEPGRFSVSSSQAELLEVVEWEAGIKTQSAKVLIIDDQQLMLTALEAQLQMRDISCEKCEGGLNATKLVKEMINNREPPFKVVLCDFSMPEQDGPTTVKIIRQLYKQARQTQPFIACVSAYQEDSTQAIAFASGMDAFFSKPISAKNLNDIEAKLAA